MSGTYAAGETAAELLLSRSLGIGVQVAVMSRLVAAVVSRVVRLRRHGLGIALRAVALAVGLTVGLGTEVLGAIALACSGLAQTERSLAETLLLCWSLGIRTQVAVVSRLIATVVSRVIRLRGSELAVALLLARVGLISLVAESLGTERLIQAVGALSEALLLCWRLGIRTQVAVMARLVAAVVSRVERLRVLVAAVLGILELVLTVRRLNITGRLELVLILGLGADTSLILILVVHAEFLL